MNNAPAPPQKYRGSAGGNGSAASAGSYSPTASSSSSQPPSHLQQTPYYPQDNPQTATSMNSAGAATTTSVSPVSAQSTSPRRASQKHRKDLPPVFWYMELGDWEKATARAKTHPKEVKTRATLRTKSMSGEDGAKAATGTKRLALHHACFKLRSAGSAPVLTHYTSSRASATPSNTEDPFLAVCKFILILLELFPEACQIRESRHGCLPLHLAAFASCYIRPPSNEDDNNDETTGTLSLKNSAGSRSSLTNAMGGSYACNHPPSRGGGGSQPFPSNNAPTTPLERPDVVSVRSASESTTSTVHSNMTAILLEESFAATQTLRKKEGGVAPPPFTQRSVTLPQEEEDNNQQQKQQPTVQQTIFISNKREQMAVKVLNALLDSYPRAIRLDSEGGRLPLHTACAGRATPRCVSLLLRAYPAAARHRNKDGFLPLHLAAHWGVSHPNVAITLLKAYPDATVGRNRWERTPLEEALVMASENGRPHQAPLVRALRKHPSYWTQPPKELFQALDMNSNHNSGSNLVDIDATFATSDDETSVDDNPRYFNAGHTILLDDEYEKVPEGESEIECAMNNHGGMLSRMTRRRSSRNIQTTPSTEITQNLPTLIKNLKWKSVISRLEMNPDEANEELVGVMTRGGFLASSCMTPLHYACERKPPVEVVQALIEANPEAVTKRMMPGGCLPLHIACTWHSSPEVVSALLSAGPTTVKVVDELGNRPLHSACFSGAAFPIVQDLLATYPKAVLSRNNQGSQPIDICRRLKHANRRAVMTALLAKKEYIIAKQKHRSSTSSGSMGNLAQTASNMNNDQYGNPSAHSDSALGYNPPVGMSSSNEEDMPGVGVEVTYEDQGKSHTLLWI